MGFFAGASHGAKTARSMSRNKRGGSNRGGGVKGFLDRSAKAATNRAAKAKADADAKAKADKLKKEAMDRKAIRHGRSFEDAVNNPAGKQTKAQDRNTITNNMVSSRKAVKAAKGRIQRTAALQDMASRAGVRNVGEDDETKGLSGLKGSDFFDITPRGFASGTTESISKDYNQSIDTLPGGPAHKENKGGGNKAPKPAPSVLANKGSLLTGPNGEVGKPTDEASLLNKTKRASAARRRIRGVL